MHVLKVKKNLQETQSKVENSKSEITRISNELTPMEVREEVGRIAEKNMSEERRGRPGGSVHRGMGEGKGLKIGCVGGEREGYVVC